MIRLLTRWTVVTIVLLLAVIVAAKLIGRRIPSQALSYYQENRGISLIDVNRRLSGWLVADETVQYAGQWSPDGRMLAYVAESDSSEVDNTDVYILDFIDGTTRNISHSDDDDSLPIWSPDGRMLAYMTQEVSGNDYLHRRMVMRVLDMDSGHIIDRLTQTTGVNIPHSWSPDSRMLAIIHQQSPQDSSNMQIHVMDAETGELVPRFTQTEGSSFSPTWSPDGGWFLFAKLDAENTIIYVMDSLTGRVRRLAEATSTLPIWSPDSRHIVYTSLESGIGGARDVMYVADAQTGQVELLTHHQGSDSHPVWSPDGRWLAFVSDRDGQSKLYLREIVTGDNTPLLSNQSYYPDPNMIWSPDGRWLAFSSPVTRRMEVYVIDMSDKSVTRLTDGGGNFVGHWQP